jgi:hypothetical protein
MRLTSVLATSLGLCLALSAVAVAQERPEGQRGDRGRGGPPGGGFMFGGFRASRMMLLRVPEVQKELELVEEQLAEIRKIEEDLRAKYPIGGGRGGPGGGRDGERREGDRTPRSEGASLAPASWYFVQAQENNQPGQTRRIGGQPPSEEDRARFEQLRTERAREERARLSEVLLPEQMKRLSEIYVQLAGIGALQDEDVAKELGINDSQKTKLADVQRQNQESFGAAMREMFQGGGGGDREANRVKMEELRKANDAKVLAVLSSDQQKKFEAMKGKAFAMPENAFRGPGGPGGPGGNRTKRGGDN